MDVQVLLRKILRFRQLDKCETVKKELIIMSGEKDFAEPELIKYAEKLDEVTMQPLGSPPTDAD